MSQSTPDDEIHLGPLGKHVHFARALAGLPRVALGIAAGATLFSIAGCGTSCNGSYGAFPPPQRDAMGDTRPSVEAAHGEVPDAGQAVATDAAHGGGPTLAPPLPAEWA